MNIRIDFDNYPYIVQWDKILGKGGFGAVHPGYMEDDPEEQIVVKEFFIDPNNPEIAIENWNDEIDAAMILGMQNDTTCNPYFVCFVGANVVKIDGKPIPVIAYKRAWGDLIKFIETYGNTINDEVKYIFITNMLTGLNLLRKHGLVHRDMKPENILAYRDREGWSFMISDLGSICAERGDILSCYADASNRTTIPYLPPILRSKSNPIYVDDPVLNGYRYEGVDIRGYSSIDDMKWADIYGMGCAIYSFLTGTSICTGILHDKRPLYFNNISYVDREGVRHTINGTNLGVMLTYMLYSPTYEHAKRFDTVQIYEQPQFVGSSLSRNITRTFNRAMRYRMKKSRRPKRKNK